MLEGDAASPLRALTRRDLMVGATVMGATVAVGSRAMAEAPGPPWVAGTVESVRPEGLVLRPANGSPPVTVGLLPDAVVLKDEPVHLDEFVPGEEVAVLVMRSEPEQIVASRLESTYRQVDGVVTRRSGNRLVAGGESLELTSESRSVDSAARIRPGNRVRARGLRNPATGALDIAVIDVTD